MPASHGDAAGHQDGARLLDNHGRTIQYLRLAVTDRCNLRCRYCRPPAGVQFVPHGEILTFEELERLAAIFCSLGVDKVRVTGGEPFVRKGCLPFLQRLRRVKGLRTLCVTTNGVAAGAYLDALTELGIDGINLSLDTLDRQRFRYITRRDFLDDVMLTMHGILKRGIPLKINSVALADTDAGEILSLAALARNFPLTVRFIERMPFSGTPGPAEKGSGNLLQRLLQIFPAMTECEQLCPSTARTFSLPGYEGKIGVVQGYSRLFCTTCNKVRITPVGMLKTCLYDNGVLNLKGLLRRGYSDTEIKGAIVMCIANRASGGHEAEELARWRTEPSMASIGG